MLTNWSECSDTSSSQAIILPMCVSFITDGVRFYPTYKSVYVNLNQTQSLKYPELNDEWSKI